MILFVGGKAQGKQAAVRAKYGAECDVWMYPEKLVLLLTICLAVHFVVSRRVKL